MFQKKKSHKKKKNSAFGGGDATETEKIQNIDVSDTLNNIDVAIEEARQQTFQTRCCGDDCC